MVKAKSEKPRLRNRGAAPQRRPAKRPKGAARVKGRTVEPGATPRYPNLEARREWDRQQHIRRGRAMGLTRRQAQRHADEDIKEREW